MWGVLKRANSDAGGGGKGRAWGVGQAQHQCRWGKCRAWGCWLGPTLMQVRGGQEYERG